MSAISIREMQEKLVGTLAHDIRNPLAAAKLALQMMGEDKTGKWFVKSHSAAQKSVNKALELISGLMDGISVKAGEGMMFNFEMTDILHDVYWVVEESNEVYTNQVNLKADQGEIRGVVDCTALRRLIENLISNAVKYGDSTKPITVEVIDAGEDIIIDVHNYGNPIPEEEMNDIFNFLDRGNKENESAAESWGMGLTLTRLVARAHGGNITVKSSAEHGTSFQTRFPKHYNQAGRMRTRIST